MLSLNQHSWRKWPIAAALLAVLFITYGINLVSRSRSIQARIGQEVRLLDELSLINDDLHALTLTHRVDVNTNLIPSHGCALARCGPAGMPHALP